MYLVTGGAGFIGSHIVEQLVRTGERVRVIDNFSTGHIENLEAVLDQIELYELDLTQPLPWKKLLRGIRYVLHQAALPSVPRSIQNPLDTHQTNSTATLNLLIGARDNQIERIIFASSSSIYGDTEELPKRESMPPNPKSPYALSKRTGEEYCRLFSELFGLSTACLRYFNVFGPRQDPNSPYAAVIPIFIRCLLKQKPGTIYGNGEQTRDFTYVQNVVDANLLACRADSLPPGAVMNVGCGTGVSVNRLWQELCGIFGLQIDPEYAPQRTGDVIDSLAALDTIHSLLDFTPRIDFSEGLQRTVNWYCAG